MGNKTSKSISNKQSSSAGKYIIAYGYDSLTICNPETDQTSYIKDLQIPEEISCVACSPDGLILAQGGKRSNKVYLWNP